MTIVHRLFYCHTIIIVSFFFKSLLTFIHLFLFLVEPRHDTDQKQVSRMEGQELVEGTEEEEQEGTVDMFITTA